MMLWENCASYEEMRKKLKPQAETNLKELDAWWVFEQDSLVKHVAGWTEAMLKQRVMSVLPSKKPEDNIHTRPMEEIGQEIYEKILDLQRTEMYLHCERSVRKEISNAALSMKSILGGQGVSSKALSQSSTFIQQVTEGMGILLRTTTVPQKKGGALFFLHRSSCSGLLRWT